MKQAVFSVSELQSILDQAVAAGETRGCQVAVYLNGERIVRLHAGFADLERRRPVTDHTLFPVYSAGKAVVSTMIHRLVETGILAYDLKIADLWPEYACNGKEETRLWHLLSHRSGGVEIIRESRLENFLDWDAMCRRIAAAPARLPVGGRTQYQSLNYSWLAGEVLRRAAGSDFKALFQQLVARPLNLTGDMYFGTDDEAEQRIAAFDVSRSLPREKPDPERCWLPLSNLMNLECVRRATLPAFNCMTSADALARHLAALLDPVDGIRLLSDATVERAATLCRAADDPIPFRPGTWELFGLGYVLSGPRDDLGRIFGHGGYGGAEGIIDRRRHLAVGFTLNTCNNALHLPLRQRIYNLIDLHSREW